MISASLKYGSSHRQHNLPRAKNLLSGAPSAGQTGAAYRLAFKIPSRHAIGQFVLQISILLIVLNKNQTNTLFVQFTI